MTRLAAALALILALCLPAAAQDRATLVADRVEVRSSDVLVAEGNVEVLWRTTRVRASRITYDRTADRLLVEGPIVLTDGPQVAVFASSAELSTDLRQGLMQSARLVLDQRLQLAAQQIARVDGRYTELSRVVASSCQVCASNPVPLWSIRARRVIHDQEARQIYFDGAQLRLMDIPVFYLPRLRFPDPTLKRATGFLFPTFRSTSQLGTGIKVPYFITLGRYADVTLTPYLSARTTTLEYRFRRAFRTGEVEIGGAFSRDDLMAQDTRYFLNGTGGFDLPRGFRLSFDVQAVSDDAYLADYGYGEEDMLESSLAVTRTRRDEQIRARLLAFRTLREGEVNSTQPGIVAQGDYERRFVPGALGGVATLGFDVLAFRRSSDLAGLGRDVARASMLLGWQRSEMFGPGIVATAEARVRAQAYQIGNDPAYDRTIARIIPEAAITLRWPFARVTPGGGRQVLEPVAMLAWAPKSYDAVPNEDSFVAELDEANLSGFSRLPGEDRPEPGLRLALGANWTHFAPQGWSLGVTAGRLFRADPAGFGAGTGLSGSRSDWLLGASLELPGRIALTGRALLDDGLDLTRGELRVGYGDPRFDVATGLLYLAAVPSENRPDSVAEWTLDTTWRINAQWSGRANWHYDFQADRATRAGLGFVWANECARVDLSLSRRFTSSTSLRPTTDFGVSVELAGFGTGGEGGVPRRRCMN